MTLRLKNTISIISVIIISAVILVFGRTIGDRLNESRVKNELRDELTSVFPELGDFSVKAVDENMPDSVKNVYLGENGAVIRLSVSGYSSGLEILCGISEGKVTGARAVSSRETLGAEKAFGDEFKGKALSEAQLVSTVSGATKTTGAFKQAILDAFTVYEGLSG